MMKFGNKLFAFALTALTGCGDAQSGESAQSDAIALLCKGTDIVDGQREEISYLLKVMPDNASQKSLHYYSQFEQRFFSSCEDGGFECSLAVGNDVITEIGTMSPNGSFLAGRKTTINRRTGDMTTAVTRSDGAQVTMFDGTCEKSQLPEEAPQQF